MFYPASLIPSCGRFLAALSSWLILGASALAGSYPQNFNNATVGTQSLGAGDTTTIGASAGPITTFVTYWAQGNKALQLMDHYGGNSASWRMADLDPGKEIQAFDATFTAGTYRQYAGSLPGAGWSLNFGAVPASGNGAGDGGFVMANGIVVAWDIFSNGGTDVPSIEVFCNGVSVGNFPATLFPSVPMSDSPVPDGGTFTLTNPVTSGTTAAIAYNATPAAVQTAMRAVPGWTLVTVTGSSGGPWYVDHGETLAYADPVSNTAGLVPANSAVTVTNTQVRLGDAQ